MEYYSNNPESSSINGGMFGFSIRRRLKEFRQKIGDKFKNILNKKQNKIIDNNVVNNDQDMSTSREESIEVDIEKIIPNINSLITSIDMHILNPIKNEYREKCLTVHKDTQGKNKLRYNEHANNILIQHKIDNLDSYIKNINYINWLVALIIKKLNKFYISEIKPFFIGCIFYDNNRITNHNLNEEDIELFLLQKKSNQLGASFKHKQHIKPKTKKIPKISIMIEKTNRTQNNITVKSPRKKPTSNKKPIVKKKPTTKKPTTKKPTTKKPMVNKKPKVNKKPASMAAKKIARRIQ
jgi:hypothetical protein